MILLIWITFDLVRVLNSSHCKCFNSKVRNIVLLVARNAEPITRLRKAQAAFLDRMSYIISTASLPEVS